MMEQMHLFDEPERIDNRFASYEEKIEKAKRVIKLAADISKTYYKEPLICCISGGKDSDVLLDLAIKSGAEFEVLHSVTTVDAPETNRHVNKQFETLRRMGIKATKKIPTLNGEKTNMWKLIVKKQMPPTRLCRYCCAVLKETSTPNRVIALGVRKAESVGRGGRSDFGTMGKTYKDARFFSVDHAEKVFDDARKISEEYGKSIEEADVYDCTMVRNAKENKDLICNPIYEFTDVEIWRYIKQNNIEVNPLYDRGFKRIGCIGCPMGGGKHQKWEFSQYPHVEELFIQAFDKMLEARKAKGKDDVTGKEGFHRWETGRDVFDWWVSDSRTDFYGQMEMFDEG